MKLIKSKKGIALLGVLVIVAISAIGAYAYFTTAGTGTGTAPTGTGTTDIVRSTRPTPITAARLSGRLAGTSAIDYHEPARRPAQLHVGHGDHGRPVSIAWPERLPCTAADFS